MYISVRDLAYFIIFCLLILSGTFLSIALFYIIRLLRKVNKIISDNSKNIDKSLGALPDTIKNLNDTLLDVKVTIDKANDLIGNVEGVVQSSIDIFDEGTEHVNGFINIINDILKVVLNVASIFKNKN